LNASINLIRSNIYFLPPPRLAATVIPMSATITAIHPPIITP
jgi:hypothetical protein